MKKIETRNVFNLSVQALVFAKLCQGQDCDPSGLQKLLTMPGAAMDDDG